MRTKLFTLALFGMMSLSFMACNEEEVVPDMDMAQIEAAATCECEGGLSDREGPQGGR